jgi:hypothetical protein
MREPVSERAQYLAVESCGGTKLFFVQEGRLEQTGLVPIFWARAGWSPSTPRPSWLAGQLRRVLAHPLISLVRSSSRSPSRKESRSDQATCSACDRPLSDNPHTLVLANGKVYHAECLPRPGQLPKAS